MTRAIALYGRDSGIDLLEGKKESILTQHCKGKCGAMISNESWS